METTTTIPSQADIHAAIAAFRQATSGLPLGREIMVPVFVCSTRRICYDPIGSIVEMPIEITEHYGTVRVVVKPAKYPKGAYPGVSIGGVPIIAPDWIHPEK